MYAFCHNQCCRLFSSAQRIRNFDLLSSHISENANGYIKDCVTSELKEMHMLLHTLVTNSNMFRDLHICYL